MVLVLKPQPPGEPHRGGVVHRVARNRRQRETFRVPCCAKATSLFSREGRGLLFIPLPLFKKHAKLLFLISQRAQPLSPTSFAPTVDYYFYNLFNIGSYIRASKLLSYQQAKNKRLTECLPVGSVLKQIKRCKTSPTGPTATFPIRPRRQQSAAGGSPTSPPASRAFQMSRRQHRVLSSSVPLNDSTSFCWG